MPRITPERLSELSCSTITDREIRKLVKAYRKRKNRWVEWGGGECPDLPHSTPVQVRFRDGSDNPELTVGFWWSSTPGGNNWLHEHSESDIIAYRVL